MFRTLRSYIFWSHERGSLHYDVMVTLILLFIFITPRFINYHDRPKFQLPSQIMVVNDGSGELIYQVRVADVLNSERGGKDEDTRIRRALRRLIEPIAGDVYIQRYQPLTGADGQVSSYRVWARR